LRVCSSDERQATLENCSLGFRVRGGEQAVQNLSPSSRSAPVNTKRPLPIVISGYVHSTLDVLVYKSMSWVLLSLGVLALDLITSPLPTTLYGRKGLASGGQRRWWLTFLSGPL